MLGHKTILV